MDKRELTRVVVRRLALAFVLLVASFALGYLYLKVDLSSSVRLVVVVLFYAFICLWPCLIVSALFRWIIGMRWEGKEEP